MATKKKPRKRQFLQGVQVVVCDRTGTNTCIRTVLTVRPRFVILSDGSKWSLQTRKPYGEPRSLARMNFATDQMIQKAKDRQRAIQALERAHAQAWKGTSTESLVAMVRELQKT